MKKTIKLIVTLLVSLIAIASTISNTIVFRNYVLQSDVLNDFKNKEPKLESNLIPRYDLSYPNINLFLVPFKTYIGRIHLRDSNYETAIKYFHEARKANPYLQVNQNYLADLYDQIGEKDSFDFYAKKIFFTQPNNPVHFAKYIKSLMPLENSFKIDSAFNSLNLKSKHIWKIYLSGIISCSTKDSLSKINIEFAKKKFQGNDLEIENMIDYIEIGKEIIEKSRELVLVADKMAEQNLFKEAKSTLESSIDLFKYNETYLKLASIHYKLENFQDVIETLDKVNKNKTYDKGLFYLLNGISLIKLGQKEEGCNLLQRSIFEKNNQAIKAIKSLCR